MNAMEYRHENVVKKIAQDGYTEQEAEQMFINMLQFLNTVPKEKESRSPSKEIDIAWHHFILHTKDYMTFCNQYFGKYLHHTPQIAGAGDCKRFCQYTCDACRGP